MTLIAGGLLGHSIGGALTPANAGAAYLRAVIAMGDATDVWAQFVVAGRGTYPFDAIGQHLYLDQRLLTTRVDVAAYYGWLRDAAASRAAPPPTYMTEGAWSTAELSHQAQARNLEILYGATRAMGFVPYALWFQMQDVPPANLSYGLATAAGDRKPSWDAYRAHAAPSVTVGAVGRRVPGVAHEEAYGAAGRAE